MAQNPPFAGAFVILHDAVGGWPTGWWSGRVVLPDEYNEPNVTDTPWWTLDDTQMQRLADLGAARAATPEEEAAAQAAKDAAAQAGEEWTGYYLPDVPAAAGRFV